MIHNGMHTLFGQAFLLGMVQGGRQVGTYLPMDT